MKTTTCGAAIAAAVMMGCGSPPWERTSVSGSVSVIDDDDIATWRIESAQHRDECLSFDEETFRFNDTVLDVTSEENVGVFGDVVCPTAVVSTRLPAPSGDAPEPGVLTVEGEAPLEFVSAGLLRRRSVEVVEPLDVSAGDTRTVLVEPPDALVAIRLHFQDRIETLDNVAIPGGVTFVVPELPAGRTTMVISASWAAPTATCDGVEFCADVFGAFSKELGLVVAR